MKMLIFAMNTASYSLERRAVEGERTNELMPMMSLPLRPHVLPHVDDIAKSACPCAWLYFFPRMWWFLYAFVPPKDISAEKVSLIGDFANESRFSPVW
jgi:hypothetical protein